MVKHDVCIIKEVLSTIIWQDALTTLDGFRNPASINWDVESFVKSGIQGGPRHKSQMDYDPTHL